MSLPLILVMLSLAAARATRLVVRDEFPPIIAVRTRIYRLGWRPDDANVLGTTVPVQRSTRLRWLAELVTCHWCASGWLSLGLVVATDVARSGGLPLPLLWWFAVWAVAAGLCQVDVRFDED